MGEVIIDRSKIENYKVGRLDIKAAIAGLSKEQKVLVKALKDFFVQYLKGEKYPKQAFDAQNFYFSKKQADSIVEIVSKHLSLISDRTISEYVGQALAQIDFDSNSFTASQVRDFRKLVSNELKEIYEEVAKKSGKADERSEKEGKPKEEKEISKKDLVEKYGADLKYPVIDFGIVSNFLKKNVFDNLSSAISKGRFSFDRLDPGITNAIEIKTPFLLKKLGVWNYDIGSWIRQFRHAERRLTTGFGHMIRSGFRVLGKKVLGFLNMMFPFKFVLGVFKAGHIAAKAGVRILGKGFKVVSSAFSLVRSIVSVAATSAVKVGGMAVKLLRRSISAISGFRGFKLTFKAVSAFFRTYAGAYVLGFVVGKIYSKLKNVIDFVKNVFERIGETYTNVRDWIEKNVYEPYIKKVVDWVSNRSKENSVYFDTMLLVFEDNTKGLVEKIDEIDRIFGIGESLEWASDLSDGIKAAADILEDLFSLSWSQAKNFIVRKTLPAVGDIVGTFLGPALATSIPGLMAALGSFAGPFGIAAGLLGGYAVSKIAGWLARIITETSDIKPVGREENPIEEYARMHLRSTTSFDEEFHGSLSGIESVKFLSSTMQRTENMAELMGSEIWSSPTGIAMEFKKYFPTADIDKIVNITGKNGRILSSKEAEEARKSLLSKFKYIDRLSYENVFGEISSTTGKMFELLEINMGGKKETPRGFLTLNEIYDMDDSFRTSDVTLSSGKASLNLSRANGNPYWIKVARDIVLLNMARQMASGQIDPFELAEAVSLSERNPKEFLQKYVYDKNLSTELNILGKPMKLSFESLITGNYILENNDLHKRFKSDAKNIMDVYRQWQGRNLFTKTGDYDAPLAFFPLDESWHVMTKRVMEPVGMENVFKAASYKIDYSAIGGFEPAFKSVETKMLVSGRSGDVSRLQKEDVAFRISQMLGEGFSEKFSSLDSGARERIVARAIEESLEGEFSLNVAARISESLQDIGSAMMEGERITFESLGDRLREHILEKSNFEEGAELTLEDYGALLESNNDVIEKSIIPALEKLLNAKVDRGMVLALFGRAGQKVGAERAVGENLVSAAENPETAARLHSY